MSALIEATARILVGEGYDRASTNRIAQLAGVSIGSLYQYFPSKDALVAAVIDRHAAELRQAARAALLSVAMQPVETAVRQLVEVAIEAHRVDPPLHRVLTEQMPRVARQDTLLGLDSDAFALVRAYLEAHRAELAVDDLDLAAFMCVTMVESLSHAAVIHRPEMLASARAEAFIDEVSRAVSGYLLAGRAGAPAPTRPRPNR